MENNQASTLKAAIDRLNPAQKEAATNTLGPMLVIAGAGSGKTSVLTTRIALLMSQGVPPERILALTFTRKAAEEMRSRIIAMQGDDARRIMMGTFHSVFIRFLRPFAQRIGFQPNFTVLDEDDALNTLKRSIRDILSPSRPDPKAWTAEQKKRFTEEDKAYKAKTLREVISMAKNNLVTHEDYYRDKTRLDADAVAGRPLTWMVYGAYQNLCHRMGMMDFDDILLYTDMLLDRNPDVLAWIAGNYDYILVDEYQDTNYAQYSILRRLTWINKNICVVGDDSQSIYAFRGARIENIFRFEKEYEGCRTVRLEKNYRSTKNIVAAANNLITHNARRIEKVCFTDAEQGDPIGLKTVPSEKEEGRFVADTIRARIAQGGCDYGDFAVLYRTNAQSRAIEDALVKARIPYTVYSGTAFFSRMEIKDVLCYYRLAVNPLDDEALLRVINKPVRGVGEASQKVLLAIAREWNCSLWEVITNPQLALCGLPAKAMEGIEAFRSDIIRCAGIAATKGAYEAAAQICDITGFYQEYATSQDEESRKRADNIRELVDSAKSYEEDIAERNEAGGTAEPAMLPGFLENIMLLTNADTGGDETQKVSLMTIHCAKGLEFDTVFITGMERHLFPLEIDKTQFEREEERRLFYVAVTRAKHKLFLSRAEQRLRFGKRETTTPSPFINELTTRSQKA